MSYRVADIAAAARKNRHYRRVLFTNGDTQIVLMSIEPSESIPLEVHDGAQWFFTVAGRGRVTYGHRRSKQLTPGSAVLVSSGMPHVVKVARGARDPLQLYTIYCPPQHA